MRLDAEVAPRVEKVDEPVSATKAAATDVEDPRIRFKTLVQENLELQPSDCLEIANGSAQRHTSHQRLNPLLNAPTHGYSLPSLPTSDLTTTAVDGSDIICDLTSCRRWETCLSMIDKVAQRLQQRAATIVATSWDLARAPGIGGRGRLPRADPEFERPHVTRPRGSAAISPRRVTPEEQCAPAVLVQPVEQVTCHVEYLRIGPCQRETATHRVDAGGFGRFVAVVG
jgi:hypothetical protein